MALTDLSEAARVATLFSIFDVRGEEVVRRRTGRVVRFTPGRKGYGSVTISAEMGRISYHRLKFALLNGRLPPLVDHRDRRQVNNAGVNLRDASKAQNEMNKGRIARKHDLPRGVVRNHKAFQARIKLVGKTICLGTFPTIEEAAAVADRARREAFGDFYVQPVPLQVPAEG